MKGQRAPKKIALALGGIMLAGSFVYADGEHRPDPAFFDPLFDASRCFNAPAGSRAVIATFRLAQNSPELRPVDRQRQEVQPDDTDPPLWPDLGTLSYPITTRSVEAQRYFDQGLRLVYAFNHGEARRAFRAAQRRDPDCAMCYWGEALVLGPNINAPMAPEAVAPAIEAVERARSLAEGTTEREQALIEALAVRYSASPEADRTALDLAYADAMGAVYRRFQDDPHIATLYAEAMMDTQPWDYWQPGGVYPKGRGGEIVEVLEKVLAEHPDHPGAIHLYIHAVEASNWPERAELHAERLEQLMPGAGHIVHMPSHIYYRLGRYMDALEANRRAVEVDERYLSKSKAEHIYAWGYYPHNVHFLMAAAQMAGDGPAAVAAAEKLAKIVPDEALKTVPTVQPVKVAVYFAHAQFSEPQTLLALPDPGDEHPYVKAMWHYARGVGHALAKNAQSAQAEAEAIAALARSPKLKPLEEASIPATQVLQIAEQVVRGRAAQAAGDLAAAAGHFRNAIAVQDQLRYMEPPYWYYPVQQSLGAVLLAQGDLEGAERAFRASLARTPNNGWSLYGLMEVYEQARRDKLAVMTKERFRKAWAGKRHVDLERL